MELKSYFDQELRTAIIFAVIGIITGYASFLLNSPGLSFGLMVIVGVVLYFIFKKIAKIQQDRKWWVSNAFIIYVLLWLITWTVYYNVGLR
jgi:multisubunit Na+/H+ antiporter MnhB subunit